MIFGFTTLADVLFRPVVTLELYRCFLQACGKVGVVREIDSDGDVKVSFGAREWSVNPEAITKVSLGSKPTVVKQHSAPTPTVSKPGRSAD